MQANVLTYFLEGAVRDSPERVAIVDGSTEVTFAGLYRRVRQIARTMLSRTELYNRPIAVYLSKSSETVAADLAIMATGNIYTNLDIKSPAQRLANILNHLGPELVVTTSALSADIERAGFPAASILVIDEITRDAPLLDEDVILSRIAQVIDTDPVCIINTSGSTGTPKGVALSHRGTIDFMDWVFATFAFDEEVRIGSLSPFYFDIYTLELLVSLAKGATLVIIPETLASFPAKLLEYLAAHRINFIFWVPTVMVNSANLGLLDKIPLPDLKRVFFAGEVFPTRHLNMWRKAVPQAQFVNLYGPIEIHVDCTYLILTEEMADDEPLSIGYPCRNSDILILNEQNEACAVGEQGELCVRGSSLALGYWNDPEKTARAFVQNPLNAHYPELIYRTGDLAVRQDDGRIFLAGRSDFQIKHLGYRIELPEIEHQVLGMPGIANACVVYDTPRKAITLFYQPSGNDVAPAAIRQFLSAIFPKYMLPTVFHSLERLPMNPNGKIDRNGLVMKLGEVG